MERRLYGLSSIILGNYQVTAKKYGQYQGQWAAWVIVKNMTPATRQQEWQGWIVPGWKRGDWQLTAVRRKGINKILIFANDQ